MSEDTLGSLTIVITMIVIILSQMMLMIIIMDFVTDGWRQNVVMAMISWLQLKSCLKSWLLSSWTMYQLGEDNLGSPVREGTRTPTHAKRKASRKVRPVVHLVGDDGRRVIKDLLDINYSQVEWKDVPPGTSHEWVTTITLWCWERGETWGRQADS